MFSFTDSPADMAGLDTGDSNAFDDDFDLFGPQAMSTSLDSAPPANGNAGEFGAPDSTCSPHDLQLSQQGFFGPQPPSGALSFFDTPELDDFSTPEETTMSTEPTPLFGQSDSFGMSQDSSAALFAPLSYTDSPDLGASMGSDMVRQPTNTSVDSPFSSAPKFQAKTKGRKRTKALEPIDPSLGATEAEKKKKKNTLAARKSRSRREAREQGLESNNSALRAQNYALKQYILSAGLPLPPGTSVGPDEDQAQ